MGATFFLPLPSRSAGTSAQIAGYLLAQASLASTGQTGRLRPTSRSSWAVHRSGCYPRAAPARDPGCEAGSLPGLRVISPAWAPSLAARRKAAHGRRCRHPTAGPSQKRTCLVARCGGAGRAQAGQVGAWSPGTGAALVGESKGSSGEASSRVACSPGRPGCIAACAGLGRPLLLPPLTGAAQAVGRQCGAGSTARRCRRPCSHCCQPCSWLACARPKAGHSQRRHCGQHHGHGVAEGELGGLWQVTKQLEAGRRGG